MPKKAVYHPDVLDELEGAVSYGLTEWPERVADLVQEFDTKIAYILNDWVERLPSEYGVLRINLGQRFPYHIIYRLKAEVVEIIAFGHNKQRDAYWLDRL